MRRILFCLWAALMHEEGEAEREWGRDRGRETAVLHQNALHSICGHEEKTKGWKCPWHLSLFPQMSPLLYALYSLCFSYSWPYFSLHLNFSLSDSLHISLQQREPAWQTWALWASERYEPYCSGALLDLIPPQPFVGIITDVQYLKTSEGNSSATHVWSAAFSLVNLITLTMYKVLIDDQLMNMIKEQWRW